MSTLSGSLRPASLLVLLVLSTAMGHAQTQTLFFEPPSYAAHCCQRLTADFNQDGKPDLVGLDGSVLLGNGDGTFRTGIPLALNGLTPLLMATADFNGDGKPDILIAGSSTFVYVFLGKGDGTFQPAVSTNLGTGLYTLSGASNSALCQRSHKLQYPRE